ncbi:MAG: hypothetical protein NC250_07210 [Alistipes senegalensis]|nr:hypothetical protein [Bacteroides cellulosilyticus]MCM1352503.1 hypothetical protein [Alistipes senegalensis]
MNNDKTKCDPCERDFQKNLNDIIREGQAPKGADHDACEKELKKAFGAETGASQPSGSTTRTSDESKTERQ